MASLDNIKMILEIEEDDTSMDGLINLYIIRAKNYVKNYLSIDEIPNALSDVVEDWNVNTKLNKFLKVYSCLYSAGVK
ncbi:head-tail connector protein [Gracilibacillus caseinilyticus]|uniref:Head-tail connector protein n=1 Tax=Gracilibacillus caseinilyticus TaxID=2932256 RepID=A0ABY4EV71_9BACI|nr:head-tail connector protein [Gracilibacillus caseinilyticus]UOQ47742.1 head-tail connector protein [Gracilibacillus caseinilyticus]